jgi:hypothetical protein
MSVDLDVDQMLVLDTVIEDELAILGMVEDPMMAALLGGVGEIAHEHLAVAQDMLDRLIAEDPSWRTV